MNEQKETTGASEARRNGEPSAQDRSAKTAEQAREIGDRVSQKAEEVTEKAKEQGRSYLNDQKSRVASEVTAFSEAARRAAERLETQSDTNLSSYVASAADHLDRLGKRIQDRSLGGLVDDVEDMARERPEVFYGGMFVAGLAAARFLKASKRQRRREFAEFSRSNEHKGDFVGASGRPFSNPAPWQTTGSFSAPVNSPPEASGLSGSTCDRPSTGGNI